SAACEQQPEKVVSKEPEVVIARIPERVKPAETKPAETKSAETKPAETKPAETRLSPVKIMEEDQSLTKGNSQKELQSRKETQEQKGTDSQQEAQLRKDSPILKVTQILNDAKALKEKQETRNIIFKQESLTQESARSSLNQAAEYQEDFKDKSGKDSNVKIEKDSKAKPGKDSNVKIEKDSKAKPGKDSNVKIEKDSKAKLGKDSNVKIEKDSKTKIGKVSEKKISKDTKDRVRENFKDEQPLKNAAAESLEDTKDGSKEKNEKNYISKGKIDPFYPLIKTEKQVKEHNPGVSKEKEPTRILTPLEKLDFSQMKLVAIVHAESGNIAMVQESGGKGYVVKIGTFIGKNSGRIIKIQKDRIVIQERVKNFKGDFVERSQEMKLHKQEYEG
ncbi:MAG: pilus assembly protein PilP, partial [Thermodesulfobacteriota bacterium]|nr:pilus assembly protein PilP [Thermodesulfobacteriota bacterium]